MNVLPNKSPVLSVLIPAYQYAEGVHRILACLYSLSFDDCEVIIFDDSPGDEVEIVVWNWCAETGAQVTYKRNRPSLGAAANWNALIDQARGKYCLLLHHDELPLGNYFVQDLIQTLYNAPNTDIFLLDCLLIDPKNLHCRRHLPLWLRAFIVRHFSQYLFRRNVIGPTASLVIRRSLYPRFDGELTWLIDVDVYVRLLEHTKRMKLCKEIKIGSILGRAESITARLGSSIPRMAHEERTYLHASHSAQTPWLGPLANESAIFGVLRTIEAACWIVFRLLTRITALIGPAPVSRSAIQKSLLTQSRR